MWIVLLLRVIANAVFLHVLFLQAYRGQKTPTFFRRAHHLIELVLVLLRVVATDFWQVVEHVEIVYDCRWLRFGIGWLLAFVFDII